MSAIVQLTSAILITGILDVTIDSVPGCDVSNELIEKRKGSYPDRTDLIAVFTNGRTEREAVLNAPYILGSLNDDQSEPVETRWATGLYNQVMQVAGKYSNEVKPLEEETDAIFGLVFFTYEEVK
jgi:hypothetical protein